MADWPPSPPFPPSSQRCCNKVAQTGRSSASSGHPLVLPRRHVADWFDPTAHERMAMMELAGARLDAESHCDGQPRHHGGEVAGQTVFHIHLHLVPRYRGDVATPHGGVEA
ncbi:MAG: HIT family protein [Hyphomicrobiaceae bacterium]